MAFAIGLPVRRSQTTVVARTFEDLDGVVLDPAGPRMQLVVLPALERQHVAGVVEHHEPRAGGALVDRCDVPQNRLRWELAVGPLRARGKSCRDVPNLVVE